MDVREPSDKTAQHEVQKLESQQRQPIACRRDALAMVNGSPERIVTEYGEQVREHTVQNGNADDPAGHQQAHGDEHRKRVDGRTVFPDEPPGDRSREGKGGEDGDGEDKSEQEIGYQENRTAIPEIAVTPPPLITRHITNIDA